MRIKKNVIEIQSSLGDIRIIPHANTNILILKHLIQTALDSYVENTVSAEVVHKEIKERSGSNYQTPGYYLRLYRLRADLTQKALADHIAVKQHHLSEMEHNKRSIGKKLAKEIAEVLNMDYRKLL